MLAVLVNCRLRQHAGLFGQQHQQHRIEVRLCVDAGGGGGCVGFGGCLRVGRDWPCCSLPQAVIGLMLAVQQLAVPLAAA